MIHNWKWIFLQNNCICKLFPNILSIINPSTQLLFTLQSFSSKKHTIILQYNTIKGQYYTIKRVKDKHFLLVKLCKVNMSWVLGWFIMLKMLGKSLHMQLFCMNIHFQLWIISVLEGTQLLSNHYFKFLVEIL